MVVRILIGEEAAREDELSRESGIKHLGILATTPEGAALCFQAFCQEGFAALGPHEHTDVTLDCIALARYLPAWQQGDYAVVRDMLLVSAAARRGGRGLLRVPG